MKKEKGHRGGQGSYCKLRVIVNLDKRRSTSLHYDICAEAKASAFFSGSIVNLQKMNCLQMDESQSNSF